MADEPLNFNPDDLGAFDRAPDPADALAAFEAATGATAVPAGVYLCRLETGELVTTRAGKPAYRLRLVVLEPTAHAGFTLWRYYPISDSASANRAKAALAPLGLHTATDLKRLPFPEADRLLVCRVLVGVQKDDPTRNDVLRFTVERDERGNTPATAARFALTQKAGEGGRAP
jgi:hypothetical protein